MIKTSAAVHTLRLLLCLTPSNQRSPYIFCGHREPAKKHSKFRSLWNGCAARPEAPACGPGPPLPHPMEPGGGCGSVPNPDQCWCSVTTPPGKAPMPRPHYKPQEPNGCSSYFLGLKVPQSLDLGIPAMTKCCNQLDVCYDTCGANKYRCDAKFRWCLHSICSDLKRSLGFVSKVEACESVADTVFNAVWTLGCRPFMNSQRSACICSEEERDEL
uniref:Group XIIB secretory phospholipase A2-like protein n=1 Tax=Cairina moschata TaxID=8855 RepID=A0A8C3CB98_CAIMO